MSLKSLLSEISFGTWLIETPSVAGYHDILAGLRSGRFAKAEPSMSHMMMGQRYTDPETNEPALKNKVVVVSFEGELTKNSGACSYGAVDLVNIISRFNGDASVKGFIFKMDGPGGNADAMPLFIELRAKLKKPVVAWVEKACSLHYYISAVCADHIMMANDFTACAGSIGAMIAFEKPERELIMVRPPQSKDKNEDYLQALAGNTELLEQKLVPLAVRFMADVKKFRPQVSDDVLHGKVVYANEAVKTGLADSIGSLDQAYNLVLAKAELKQNNQ